jgi:hypothetical protein
LPETLAPEIAASRALDSIHRWLHHIGRMDPGLNLMAACFAALIVRGGEAWLIGAGDARLYMLRDGQLSQLGEDDAVQVAFGAYVDHAVGLHATLATRVENWALREGDRLLLCSDGLYRRLPGREFRAVLSTGTTPATGLHRLVQLARARGSSDDVSAAVVDVRSIPALDFGYLERVLGELPIPAVPTRGDVVRVDSALEHAFHAPDFWRWQPALFHFLQDSVCASRAKPIEVRRGENRGDTGRCVFIIQRKGVVGFCEAWVHVEGGR